MEPEEHYAISTERVRSLKPVGPVVCTVTAEWITTYYQGPFSICLETRASAEQEKFVEHLDMIYINEQIYIGILMCHFGVWWSPDTKGARASPEPMQT